MFDKLQEILRFRLKMIVIGMFALGIGLVAWKFMSAYFDRNQHAWETKLHADVAELLVLADHKVSDAQMKVEWDCGGFSLSKEGADSAACTNATKKLAAAEQHKATVEASRENVLSMPGQTKKYYDGLIESSKQKPLPRYFFVCLAFIILATILFLLMPTIQKALSKDSDKNDESLI